MPSSGFTVDGTDLDNILVPKSYLIDRYPELSATYKTAGLWSWGQGASGKIGDNTVTNRSSPVQTISFSSNWKTVSSGRDHKAAIKTDGTLWLWGLGSGGQLGTNVAQTSLNSPVQTISATTNWKQVSCGEGHTSAIKTDGTLWVWGTGGQGQMGDNTIVNKSSPVQTISVGTNWKQVSCGYFSVMAIKTDGTLWGWGGATSGELGNNVATIDRSSPVQTIALGTNWKQVSCGKRFSAAVKTDGTLWLWGANTTGQLGINATTSRSSPVQTIALGTDWKQVSCGLMTTAIKTDGTLWTWGVNDLGQLGDNTTVNKSSPVQTVAGGTNWAIVSAGLQCAAAIKTNGTLWVWGRNVLGEVGDNTTLNRSSPVQTVAGGTNWKFIAPWGGYWTSLSAIRDDSADFGIGSM